eukprot:6827690-Alexandrium_andersonii.AAC.1
MPTNASAPRQPGSSGGTAGRQAAATHQNCALRHSRKAAGPAPLGDVDARHQRRAGARAVA